MGDLTTLTGAGSKCRWPPGAGDGEAVLSVETEAEFWKAVTTGELVELTHELADKIGLMEEDVGTDPTPHITRRFSLFPD